MSADTINGLLTNMRGPSGTRADGEDNKFFKDYLTDAWKVFGFTGKQDLLSFEAFLIEAITCAIIPKPDTVSKERYKIAMRRKDICLLSFGLLAGYCHTSKDGVQYSASQRHEQYLKKNMSDFIAITYFDSLLPNNYDVDMYQKKAKDIIPKDDERCRRLVAGYLSKENNCQKCLAVGVKKFIKENEKGEKYIDLPKPCYTLENFPPPNTNSKEEGSDEQKDKTGKYHKPTSVLAKIPWRLKLPIILASIVAVPLISVLSILIYQYIVTPPEIKQISAKTEVLVRPGEKEDLALDVYPDSADWGQLSSKIGNKEIVGVTNDWWVVGLDGLGNNDSDNTAIVIWGGKAEPALITVTVVKPGSRGK